MERASLEVAAEIGLAFTDWGARPFDPGAWRVAHDGMVVLLDREGTVTELARAVRENRDTG